MALSSMSKLYAHLDSENDLWVEILTRLPVRVLGRFQCVCKSWNSFISSSFFVKRHLSLVSSSSTSNVFGKSYFLWNSAMTNYSPSYGFYYPGASLAEEYPSFLRSPFQHHNPLNQRILAWIHLIDVVHGVVCLSYSDTRYTVLWNPTIRKYLEILPPPPFHKTNYSVLGFGSGRKNYDFKVVCEVWQAGLITYEVFSARDGGCWRKADVRGLIVPGELGTGCFSNGTIYWIVSKKLLLVMFDCEHDEFKTMELPQQFNQSWIYSKKLYTFCGMLSVILRGQSEEPYQRWLMEEYDGARTWKRLYVTRDFVIVYDDGVYQCSPQCGMVSKKSIQSLEEYWGKQPFNAYVFEESMFLMDAKSQAKSYTVKEDEDGKIYYEKDGTQVSANYYDH